MKVHLTYEFDGEEELRAHLSLMNRTDTAVRAPVPASAPVAAPEETASEDIRSASDVDADQMPYDPAIHSDPPQVTGDGLWRAKRGKSEEAKAARAAFKARGGAVVPPVDLPVAPVVAPVAAAPVLPAMPVATAPALPGLPASAPEPISLERVIEKITGMMSRNTLAETTLAGLYVKHSGQADPTASFQVFNTNESARATLYAELCQIEPDLK